MTIYKIFSGLININFFKTNLLILIKVIKKLKYYFRKKREVIIWYKYFVLFIEVKKIRNLIRNSILISPTIIAWPN